MTTTETGRKAENTAAEHLKSLGYKILEQNWKTRVCEIDIVAQKDKTIFFVEVKYRQTARNGSGLDYITSKKLGQMQFAAEQWIADHDWQNDYCLSAIEVAGEDFTVGEFIENLT